MVGTTLAGLVLATAAPPARAQDQSGGLPGDWLSRYAGARTLGLGGAFVAAADDGMGLVWNPAGLSQLYRNEVVLETQRLYEGTAVHALSFAVPSHRLPSFGFAVLALSSGDFERTNELNDPLGTFGEGETAFLFGLSKAVSPGLAVGANLKVARQSIEDWSAGGVGFDLGAMYALSPMVRAGAAVRNLGGPSLTLRETKETFPTEISGGVAALVLRGRGLVSAQLDQVEGTGVRLHGGAEYWLQPSVALRIGYDDAYATGGFSYRMNGPMQFDYGVSDQPLGMTHRFGLAYRFGGFFASSKADPEVFSPTGENSVTKIRLRAHTKADAESWTLTLLNKSAEVVRRFGGKGLPPAHILWDGKDEAGLPVADGVYRYRLVVLDREGREIESPSGTVEIFTTGPQGSVPIVPAQ
jgi:hypothetical protein